MDNNTNVDLSRVQAVIFDADGTLMDTYNIILSSMRHTICDHLGKDLTEGELMAHIGTPLVTQMNAHAEGDEAKAEELIKIYREHNASIHDAGIREFAGTKEALERLRDAGYKMGVVTSKSHNMAERGLTVTGLIDFFDVLIASDDWPEHKPAPGPIIHAADVLGVRPEDCAYVGDSPFDIQAANGAGCVSVAALWGMFSKNTLEAEAPDLEYAHLSDFVDALLKAREG